MIVERLSGNGCLLLIEERRCTVGYALAVIETAGIKSIEGTLAGDFEALSDIWESGNKAELLLADGRTVTGIINTIEGTLASFLSTGEQAGF